MTPTHTRRDAKHYRYYVSRLAPGEDRETVWRVPAGEIERIVTGGTISWLRNNPDTTTASAEDVVVDVNRRSAFAAILETATLADQRAALLDLRLNVKLLEGSISMSFGKSTSTPVDITARLIRRPASVSGRRRAEQRARPGTSAACRPCARGAVDG